MRKPVSCNMRTTKAQMTLRSLISAFVVRILRIISVKFEIGRDRTIWFGVTHTWALNNFPIDLLWRKCCLEDSAFTFDRIIFKLAGNRTVEFEFRPYRTRHFRVTCSRVPKNTIFDLVWSIACLFLIRSLWDLQIIQTGINFRTSLNSGQIGYWLWSILPLSTLLIAHVDL